nr:hypothetical protein Iba_chr14dCG14360 [Ipomoea batatas]GME10377.1 hypothetical protein Iba_scaffold10051CG0030 [Ipomoea batatas]
MLQKKAILCVLVISFLLSSAQCFRFIPKPEAGGTINGGGFFFFDYTGAKEWNNEEIGTPDIISPSSHGSEFDDANL